MLMSIPEFTFNFSVQCMQKLIHTSYCVNCTCISHFKREKNNDKCFCFVYMYPPLREFGHLLIDGR